MLQSPKRPTSCLFAHDCQLTHRHTTDGGYYLAVRVALLFGFWLDRPFSTLPPRYAHQANLSRPPHLPPTSQTRGHSIVAGTLTAPALTNAREPWTPPPSRVVGVCHAGRSLFVSLSSSPRRDESTAYPPGYARASHPGRGSMRKNGCCRCI